MLGTENELNGQGTKIYVLHYKQGTVLPLGPMYSNLMAGNALLKNQFKIIGDNSGEHISEKNPHFSELTGIYWIWKNTENEVTGTCHYRRFFTAQPEPLLYKLKRIAYFPAGLAKKRFGIIYTQNTKGFQQKILSQNELHGLLSRYDAILPVARKMKYSVEKHYTRYHDSHDLAILRTIIQEKHPEYETALNKVLSSKRLYANNMFVLKNEHFQEFMSWWFSLLFEFERRTDLDSKTGYQQRIIGFIAERLLNVWFMKKQLKCVELPIIYFKRLKLE